MKNKLHELQRENTKKEILTDLIRERMSGLITVLNKACYEYYQLDKPSLTDKEYDDIYDELEKLEKETKIIMSNSPTQKVQGFILDKLEKVKHSKPMLSADKTKDPMAIKKFIGNELAVASWKLDGCFIKDTRITMSDYSTKYIQDIEVGDEVLSFDEHSRKLVFKKVTNVFYNGKKEFNDWNRIKIKRTDGSRNPYILSCTKNHKIFTPSGWVESKDLSVGDYVYYNDYKISKEQESFLLGIGLGDGWLLNRSMSNNNESLEFHYSKTKNEGYDILIELANQLFKHNNPKITNRKSGYGSDMTEINLHKILVPEYMSNSKNILRCGFTFTEDICEKLTPLSIALLYMDDGSKATCRDDGYYNTKNARVRASFHTNRHKKESVEIFSKYLNKLGYQNNIMFEKEVKTENGGDGYTINLNVDGTEKLFDDICTYIPKELRKIKLGLKEKWQNAEVYKWWEKYGKSSIVESRILEIENGYRKKKENKIRINRKSYADAYDIEVEDTHTYFANGYAVHNCTIVLRYEKGEFKQAITRGNGGEEGEDVTHTVKAFTNIPMKIKYCADIEVRGEGVISWKNFDKINEELVEPYSHPRNLASGSVRQLDPSITKKRNLEFKAFELVQDGMNEEDFYNQGMHKDHSLEYLEDCGFDVVEHVLINVEDVNRMILRFDPTNYEYPVDGIIFEIDNRFVARSMGSTSHHDNKLMALKWEDETYETTLRDIEWNTTRTGLCNPTAVFDTVEIDGSQVSRATLHNLSIIKKLQLGIGDRISVYKANMIIPKVHESLTKSDTYIPPTNCPCCQHTLELVTKEDVQTLMCRNTQCSSQLISRLENFASRNATNIEGLSTATLEKFLDMGWLTCLSDIYKLKEHEEEMLKMEGFKRKSVDKLLDSIEKSKTVKLENFILALGIPSIGKSTSKDLAKKFISWENLESALAYSDEKDDDFISTIGVVSTKNIINWFNSEYFGSDDFDNFDDELNILSYELPKANSQIDLNGQVFVITGSLSHYTNRDALKAEIEALGGKVNGSVSKNTNFLINNDYEASSSKNKKARELAIPIITESDFIKIIKREVI